jgi:hypothetical protein
MHDTITGDVLEYEDIEDFRSTARHSFDDSVHEQFDQLCDAYQRGEYTGEYENFLGIELF